MAFDEQLVARVRERLLGTQGVTEMKMFGGWAVTVGGKMAVGVMGDDLIVRVGPGGFDRALAQPGARPFDFTGRPMNGWVYVDGSALGPGPTLSKWVRLGVTYAQGLPPKRGSRASRPGRVRRAAAPPS